MSNSLLKLCLWVCLQLSSINFPITDLVECQTEKWDLHSISVSVLCLVKQACRYENKGSWGLQPANGLCLYGMDVSSWRHSFPEAVNGHVKVGDTSALALVQHWTWPDQLRFYVVITHPSFWALHHHGHRLFSALFILSHKPCASPLQQELVRDDVSVRKCHAFIVSDSIMTWQRWLLMRP